MKRLSSDLQFIAAMALGPCVWAILLFLQVKAVATPGLALLITVCLVYPVLEELAFRGFLQSWLLDFKWFARCLMVRVSVANVVTSLVFAAAHLLNQSLLWAALVFFPSLVFGYFRDRYNSVVPSIILHCWYNTGFFLVLN